MIQFFTFIVLLNIIHLNLINIMYKKIIFFIYLTLCLISCDKKININTLPKIDVSKQWNIDDNGQLNFSPNDKQWQFNQFNTQEIDLFSSLDTSDLSGTTTPDKVNEISPSFNSIYPNPFRDVNSINISFSNNYTGSVVFKYVIVDINMQPVIKKSFKLITKNSRLDISFFPTYGFGKYRLYYSLSSQNDKHFYTSWGNIEKKEL
jgi:hypothetical protein